MNADCDFEIIMSITLLSLVASTFFKIFIEQLIRLKGLKSPIVSGPFFLGTRTMNDELMPEGIVAFLWNSLNISRISSLIAS